MQLVVICNEAQKAEWMSGGVEAGAANWVSDPTNLPDGDAVIDLTFQNTPERLAVLQGFPTIIINSVAETSSSINARFVRINGWSTFLKGSVVEAAGDEAVRAGAAQALGQLGKKVEWLLDEPGFVTPRVISAIINEAYFALSEGVSTKGEIDTAMKLGTAYPYGPFQWSEQIGLKNIAALLTALSKNEARYQPCALLLQEAAI